MRYVLKPSRTFDGSAQTVRSVTREARAEQMMSVFRTREERAPTKGLPDALRALGVQQCKPLGAPAKSLEQTLGKETLAKAVASAGIASPRALSLLGSWLVEVENQERADAIERALPGWSMVPDLRLELIAPVQTTAADASVLTADAGWAWFHEQVHVESARSRGLTGKNVGIAVLDTGVDGAHPELSKRVKSGTTMDVANGKSTTKKTAVDTGDHGTHVAGIIAGRKVGIAPGADIHSVTMIPDGRGWYSEFILALEWAASSPSVQIVNMSAGIPGFHDQMRDAILELLGVGVLPVIAVGNEGRNRTRSPGNYAAPLTVGATDASRRVAAFSGGGQIVFGHHTYSLPDLVAPGDEILSCVPGGGYAYKSGTSMATPVVAAVAALLIEQYRTLRTDELMDALTTTAEDLGFKEARQGAGLVCYRAAAAYLRGDESNPPRP